MLENIDTSLRLLVIGQLSMLVIVLFLREHAKLAMASGVLILSIGGYVIVSSPILSTSLILLKPLLVGFAIAVPYALWWFSASLFELRLPHRGWILLLLIPLLAWLAFLLPAHYSPYEKIINTSAKLVSIIVVLHMLYKVISGHRDDLFEIRRKFRILMIISIALTITSIVIVELYLEGPAPVSLQLISVSVIEILTLTLGIPLLLHRHWSDPEPFSVKINKATVTNEALHQSLLDAMNNRAYAKHNLTITSLAKQLNSTEHELRHLINKSLNYRNFSSYINGYRIQEAAKRMKLPSEEQLPILTIALDAGFGSIGPFNRAFKQLMNMTPTEYKSLQSS